ncbi:MAG: hypothetical protein ACLRPV_07135 [Lacrimispora saccharolytica]
MSNNQFKSRALRKTEEFSESKAHGIAGFGKYRQPIWGFCRFHHRLHG